MEDSSPVYCVACDRMILPQHNIVVEAMPALPSSPEARRKAGPRTRSGLVNGTGRVRPNGTIKAAPPVKTRIEIDQSPAPPYCSSQCRQRDGGCSSAYPSSSSGSDDSDESVEVPTSRPASDRSTPHTRSLARLQRTYGLKPLPPPTALTYDENRGTDNVVVAAKPLVVPVPGWSDDSVYSCLPPPQSRTDSASSLATNSSYSSSSSSMLSSFEDSFARRTPSRVSLSTSPASSALASSPRKLSGASMLCVPDFLVPKPKSSASADSLDTLPLQQRTGRRHSAGVLPAQTFRRTRSPLSVGSPTDDESVSDMFEHASRPGSRLQSESRPSFTYETRSWSYDNVRTYPMMSMPPVKEMRMVNGVETVVEVQPKRQRLFVFAGTPVTRVGSA